MPKYWVKSYFAHGSFPEVGQKQKTEKKKEEERLKVGNTNDQHIANATSGGAHKAAWAKSRCRCSVRTTYLWNCGAIGTPFS